MEVAPRSACCSFNHLSSTFPAKFRLQLIGCKLETRPNPWNILIYCTNLVLQLSRYNWACVPSYTCNWEHCWLVEWYHYTLQRKFKWKAYLNHIPLKILLEVSPTFCMHKEKSSIKSKTTVNKLIQEKINRLWVSRRMYLYTMIWNVLGPWVRCPHELHGTVGYLSTASQPPDATQLYTVQAAGVCCLANWWSGLLVVAPYSQASVWGRHCLFPTWRATSTKTWMSDWQPNRSIWDEVDPESQAFTSSSAPDLTHGYTYNQNGSRVLCANAGVPVLFTI